MLTAKISADWSDIPFGGTSIETSVIELPDNIGLNKPLSNSVLVSLFTTTNLGASTYPTPPFVTVIIPTVFESFSVIFGDMKASGWRVLSEEYSNPSFTIFVSNTLPIVLVSNVTSKFLPLELLTPLNNGSFLYPVPTETKCILSTAPDAEVDLVVYSKLSQSEEV